MSEQFFLIARGFAPYQSGAAHGYKGSPVSSPDNAQRAGEKTTNQQNLDSDPKKLAAQDLGLLRAAGNSPDSETGDICAAKHKGNEFSVAANPSQSAKQSEQKRILEALRVAKLATCESLEYLTGLRHQSCSARISELKRDGKIKPIERKGRTRSGSPCAIYQIV